MFDGFLGRTGVIFSIFDSFKGCNEDPSGRAQTVHLKAYGNNENNIVSGSDTKSPLQNGKSKDVDAISAKDGLVSHPSKRVKQL